MPSRRNLLKTLIAGPFALGWRRLLGAPLDDAAPAYRRVFAMIPEWTEPESEIVRKAVTTPLNQAARRIVSRSEALLKAFREASGGATCTWDPVRTVDDLGRDGLDYRTRNVGRLAILRARIEFAARQDSEALDDVFATVRFGRHVGRAGVLIAQIYRMASENQAIEALAAVLPDLDRARRSEILRRIEALPSVPGWDVVLREEAEFICATLRSHVTKIGWPTNAEGLVKAELSPEEDANRIYVLTNGDRAKVLALIEAVGPMLRGLEETLKAPHRGFVEKIGPFTERARQSNPWVASVMANLDGVKWSTDRTAMLWLMLRAAILRLNGDKAGFSAVRDPGGDGPFACTEHEGGFLLESALRDKDNPPIALSIGRSNEKTRARD